MKPRNHTYVVLVLTLSLFSTAIFATKTIDNENNKAMSESMFQDLKDGIAGVMKTVTKDGVVAPADLSTVKCRQVENLLAERLAQLDSLTGAYFDPLFYMNSIDSVVKILGKVQQIKGENDYKGWVTTQALFKMFMEDFEGKSQFLAEATTSPFVELLNAKLTNSFNKISKEFFEANKAPVSISTEPITTCFDPFLLQTRSSILELNTTLHRMAMVTKSNLIHTAGKASLCDVLVPDRVFSKEMNEKIVSTPPQLHYISLVQLQQGLNKKNEVVASTQGNQEKDLWDDLFPASAPNQIDAQLDNNNEGESSEETGPKVKNPTAKVTQTVSLTNTTRNSKMDPLPPDPLDKKMGAIVTNETDMNPAVKDSDRNFFEHEGRVVGKIPENDTEDAYGHINDNVRNLREHEGRVVGKIITNETDMNPAVKDTDRNFFEHEGKVVGKITTNETDMNPAVKDSDRNFFEHEGTVVGKLVDPIDNQIKINDNDPKAPNATNKTGVSKVVETEDPMLKPDGTFDQHVHHIMGTSGVGSDGELIRATRLKQAAAPKKAAKAPEPKVSPTIDVPFNAKGGQFPAEAPLAADGETPKAHHDVDRELPAQDPEHIGGKMEQDVPVSQDKELPKAMHDVDREQPAQDPEHIGGKTPIDLATGSEFKYVPYNKDIDHELPAEDPEHIGGKVVEDLPVVAENPSADPTEGETREVRVVYEGQEGTEAGEKGKAAAGGAGVVAKKAKRAATVNPNIQATPLSELKKREEQFKKATTPEQLSTAPSLASSGEEMPVVALHTRMAAISENHAGIGEVPESFDKHAEHPIVDEDAMSQHVPEAENVTPNVDLDPHLQKSEVPDLPQSVSYQVEQQEESVPSPTHLKHGSIVGVESNEELLNDDFLVEVPTKQRRLRGSKKSSWIQAPITPPSDPQNKERVIEKSKNIVQNKAADPTLNMIPTGKEYNQKRMKVSSKSMDAMVKTIPSQKIGAPAVKETETQAMKEAPEVKMMKNGNEKKETLNDPINEINSEGEQTEHVIVEDVMEPRGQEYTKKEVPLVGSPISKQQVDPQNKPIDELEADQSTQDNMVLNPGTGPDKEAPQLDNIDELPLISKEVNRLISVDDAGENKNDDDVDFEMVEEEDNEGARIFDNYDGLSGDELVSQPTEMVETEEDESEAEYNLFGAV